MVTSRAIRLAVSTGEQSKAVHADLDLTRSATVRGVVLPHECLAADKTSVLELHAAAPGDDGGHQACHEALKIVLLRIPGADEEHRLEAPVQEALSHDLERLALCEHVIALLTSNVDVNLCPHDEVGHVLPAQLAYELHDALHHPPGTDDENDVVVQEA